jgi:hypothetical protein
MDVVTLLIAVVALVIAVMAFQRTGGVHDLRHQMDELSVKSEQATKGVREMTADALNRLETLIRGQQKSSSTSQGTPEGQPPPVPLRQDTPEDHPTHTEHKP